MKSSENLLRYFLIGIIAIVAFLIWQRHQHSESQTPAPAGGASTLEQSLGVVPRVQSQPEAHTLSPNPTDDIRALIHLKFRQWLESQTGDTETQDRLLKEFLAMLTDENAAEIIKSLSQEELLCPLGMAALDRWLKVDVTNAANWVAALTNATEEQAWLVGRKMLEDPVGFQSLQSYSDQLTNTQWKQQFLEGTGLHLLTTNPAVAIDLAQRMDPGNAQTNLLETIAYDWILREPDAALDWIENVEDPALREKLIVAGAKACAITGDPSLGAEWLVSEVKSEGILNETALNIVEIWADKEPAEVAKWVAQFSGGPRDGAVDIVLRYWLKSDSGAANAWIQSLPDRDNILARLKAAEAESQRPDD